MLCASLGLELESRGGAAAQASYRSAITTASHPCPSQHAVRSGCRAPAARPCALSARRWCGGGGGGGVDVLPTIRSLWLSLSLCLSISLSISLSLDLSLDLSLPPSTVCAAATAVCHCRHRCRHDSFRAKSGHCDSSHEFSLIPVHDSILRNF